MQPAVFEVFEALFLFKVETKRVFGKTREECMQVLKSVSRVWTDVDVDVEAISN